MKQTKERWKIIYLFHNEDFESIVDSLEQAFEVVDEMEGTVGGFASSIGPENQFPTYMRHINNEEGVAYWVSLETGERFVHYRR